MTINTSQLTVANNKYSILYIYCLNNKYSFLANNTSNNTINETPLIDDGDNDNDHHDHGKDTDEMH